MGVINGKMVKMVGLYIGLRMVFLVELGSCKELITIIILQLQVELVMGCHHMKVVGKSFQPLVII
jgi:hypothetical protein